ncbi:MAG: hypothetical protein LBS56_06785 [Propionibacteriaceae bacterium]|jgi:hypothetical protein|nr:hypothetical protein [Propionibacteriaceae bacterium]
MTKTVLAVPDEGPGDALAQIEGVSEADITEASPQAPDEGTLKSSTPDTFPRSYVEALRAENARHRTRAAEADSLAKRLHAALVAATGRLQDPDDLPYDPAHLDDPEALRGAIDGLLGRKPHLASRRPVGDIGQGATAGAEPFNLAAILRANAN